MVKKQLMVNKPVKPHRWQPLMTPSTFNIGMILNIKWVRSSSASGVSLVKKSKIPSMIHEALVSPGWTRALKTMIGLSPKGRFCDNGFMLAIMVGFLGFEVTDMRGTWWSLKLDVKLSCLKKKPSLSAKLSNFTLSLKNKRILNHSWLRDSFKLFAFVFSKFQIFF